MLYLALSPQIGLPGHNPESMCALLQPHNNTNLCSCGFFCLDHPSLSACCAAYWEPCFLQQWRKVCRLMDWGRNRVGEVVAASSFADWMAFPLTSLCHPVNACYSHIWCLCHCFGSVVLVAVSHAAQHPLLVPFSPTIPFLIASGLVLELGYFLLSCFTIPDLSFSLDVPAHDMEVSCASIRKISIHSPVRYETHTDLIQVWFKHWEHDDKVGNLLVKYPWKKKRHPLK